MLKVNFSKSFSSGKKDKLVEFKLRINFYAPPGFTVLFGPSGCGKSSTLKAIAGLLTPDWGEIELEDNFLGKRVFFSSQKQINLPPPRRQIGYVWQNSALFPHLSVEDNIGFALNSWPTTQRRQRIKELVKLMQLEKLLQHSINNLSGGQSQRVAIARALAPQPQLLLLDEPFTALDEKLRATLRRELKLLQQRLQLPIILVTHSRADALELADYLVIVEEGKVKTTGLARELLVPRSYSLPQKFQWG